MSKTLVLLYERDMRLRLDLRVPLEQVLDTFEKSRLRACMSFSKATCVTAL